MPRPTIVLVASITVPGRVDSYAQDFAQAKLSENLAIGYLKGYLQRVEPDWRVVAINPGLTGQQIANVAEEAASYQPVLVGISVVHQWHRNFAIELAEQIRQKAPAAHIALGGVFPTSDWEGMLWLGRGAIDSICRGEGEQTLHELVSALVSARDWRQVPGIAYVGPHGPVATKPRTRQSDLSQISPPDRSQLPSAVRLGGVIQMEASRGCNAACTFCDMRRTGWVPRDPKAVVDELEDLVRAFPGRSVWFVDNMFLGFGPERFQRALTIAREITQRGISVRFSFQDRAENVDEQVFLAMKGAGLNTVYVGVESLAQGPLRRWHKGTTVEQNKQAIRTLRRLGIYTHIGLIAFDDGTTLDEIEENITGLHEVAAGNAFLHLHNFNELIPYSGTYLEQLYLRRYGHRPERMSRDIWHLESTPVSAIRRWAWDYLACLWPVTQVIFANFDDPAFQLLVGPILTAKNHCLLQFLKALLQGVRNGATEAQLENHYYISLKVARESLDWVIPLGTANSAIARLRAAVAALTPGAIRAR
jgi:radical SAM superfamily enzyme YgiQ (UPF0313 family)